MQTGSGLSLPSPHPAPLPSHPPVHTDLPRTPGSSFASFPHYSSSCPSAEGVVRPNQSRLVCPVSILEASSVHPPAHTALPRTPWSLHATLRLGRTPRCILPTTHSSDGPPEGSRRAKANSILQSSPPGSSNLHIVNIPLRSVSPIYPAYSDVYLGPC